ncbi:MAG TPA: threonine-phosphate decarboxylase CobD [Syntrophobacteraceae bacterium]|nr:threonine-phosphate decarboxylase CobD [Syntrophobacteraceae bacterium]
MTLAHGGNVYEVASRLGCSPEAILDYSASINPLGPPPGLWDHIRPSFRRVEHYPDIHNRGLVQSLADFHTQDPRRVVVGNGSTELIYWLPRAFGLRKALMVLPAFGEYQRALEIQDVELYKIFTRPEDNFQPTVEDLEGAMERFSPDALLLTNPGSPAGTVLPEEVRQWALERSRKDSFLCVVDEVFVDFCEEESLKGHVEKLDRLVVIRSMTKFYGVPGLRIGYLFASRKLAERLRGFVPPWSVNTVAQVAGEYCLNRPEYRLETLSLIEVERTRMARALGELPGCRVFPGAANYLLLRLPETFAPARVLRDDLLASHRVLVRDCSSFEGMDDRYVRLAVRLPEENRKVLQGIAQWWRGQGKVGGRG